MLSLQAQSVPGSNGNEGVLRIPHYWNLTIRLSTAISRTLIRGVLPLYREAVGVFYSPSWLSKLYFDCGISLSPLTFLEFIMETSTYANIAKLLTHPSICFLFCRVTLQALLIYDTFMIYTIVFSVRWIVLSVMYFLGSSKVLALCNIILSLSGTLLKAICFHLEFPLNSCMAARIQE